MSSKGIKWESKPELLEWKSLATEKQRFYYEFFRNRKWETYEEPEFPFLKLKIGYALFGPPVEVKDTAVDSFYTYAQKTKIESIFNVIKKVNNEKVIIVSFLFFISIIDNKYTEFPVFRVLKIKHEDGTEACNFVDSFGYLYKNWSKFLQTNVIPYCIYCYPKDGFYSCNETGDLELDFSYSPQSYSLLSGVVSAVASVGSAVGTVLPGGRNAQQDLLPIPLISIVKGVMGRNKWYWIPVTPASGSADLYAVHSTQALAQSSQTTEKIPLIILDGLQEGYINITWYAVMNQISYIIQHSSKTTSMHVAQVITSALFFCHCVLSPEITKQIIKEIRADKNNKTLLTLDHFRKIALENSLQLTEENPGNPIIKGLKFIDDRSGLINEIVEKRFKTHFMIPDEDGKHYTLGTLVEKITSSIESKKYADIITNYCLVLENTIRNCKSCCRAMDNQGKFIGTLNKEFSVGKEKEEDSKIEEDIKLMGKNELNVSQNFIDSPEKKNVSSSPTSLKIESETKAKNDWLLVNIFNASASPLITPPHKKEKLNEEGSAIKDVTGTNSESNTPKKEQKIINDETPKIEKTMIQQTNRIKEIRGESIKLHLENNSLSTQYEEIISKIPYGYANNINTPERKNYSKKMENVSSTLTSESKEQNNEKSFAPLKVVNASTPNESNTLPNESNYNSVSETENIREKLAVDSIESNDQNKNSIGLDLKDIAEDKLLKISNNSGNFNLSGKTFSLTRQNTSEAELDPLNYFKELVQKELNDTEPLQFSSENDKSWQFVMPAEVQGVKLVKISIADISGEEELITVNYY